MNKKQKFFIIVVTIAIVAVSICLSLAGITWLHRSDRLQRFAENFLGQETFVSRSKRHTIQVELISDNLSYPWGIALLPSQNKALITEKITAVVKVINLWNGKQLKIARIPDVTPLSAGAHCGLLDISLHPEFEDNQYVYFAYTIGTEINKNVRPRLSRARFTGSQLVDFEHILTLEKGSGNAGTCGLRMAWLPDNTLLMSIGHAESKSAQDLSQMRGKMIRINDDGSAPHDNPFIGHTDARPEIYSLGHRDPQGLAITVDGLIWAAEHGPYGGDELNIINPGENYGWPLVSYGVRYPSQSKLIGALEFIGIKNRISRRRIRRIGGVVSHSAVGFAEPVASWGVDGNRSIAPSGMIAYSGRQFEHWKGNLLIATLYKRHIRRVVVEGSTVIDQERLLNNKIGRIRHLAEATDGSIYVITDSATGALYRLTKK